MKQETIKELFTDEIEIALFHKAGMNCHPECSEFADTRIHTAPIYLHEWWKESNEVVESLKRLAERTRDKGDGEYSRLIDIQIDEYEGYRKDVKDVVLKATGYNIKTDKIDNEVHNE